MVGFATSWRDSSAYSTRILVGRPQKEQPQVPAASNRCMTLLVLLLMPSILLTAFGDPVSCNGDVAEIDATSRIQASRLSSACVHEFGEDDSVNIGFAETIRQSF